MKEKKTPKHPIVRERERELGSNFLREKEDQGFGVGDYWLNPPPLFMGSVFWFSAHNCLCVGLSSLCRSTFICLFFFSSLFFHLLNNEDGSIVKEDRGGGFGLAFQS